MFCALAACASPGIYSTARTLPAGESGGTVIGEFGYSTFGPNEDFQSRLIQPPSVEGRYGLLDRVDAAFRIPGFSGIGGDIKWNPIRSRFFDLSFNPRALFWTPGMFHGLLPTIIDFNITDWLTIVPHGGPAFAAGKRDENPSREEPVLLYTGFLIDAGLGINVRISEEYAVHAEAACLVSLPMEEARMCTFGLGLNYGTRPPFGPDPEQE